jgi:nucleotide-binding universal stress UspA family protein
LHPPIGDVLVGLKNLDVADASHLEEAARLATALGTRVVAFHAVSSEVGGDGLEAARRRLQELAAEQAPGAAVVIDVRPVEAHERAAAIAGAAGRHGCGLILLGAKGGDPLLNRLLGSTVHGVLGVARCPVLVLRGSRVFKESGPPTLMVAANEPKDSEAALQVGLGLAQALRARVRVVHVGSTEEGAIAELLHAADTHPSQTILAEAARPFEEAGLEVSRVAVANASGVAEELAKAAEAADADIILVGPSGEPDVRDWLLGSVAEGVLHHTRRAVLVVPARR